MAAAGVDAVPGDHLLSADGPDELCAAILRVLDNPVERRRLSIAGRERVLATHAWPNSMQRLDALMERCLRGTRPVGQALPTPAEGSV
jgi:hypothetical protein